MENMFFTGDISNNGNAQGKSDPLENWTITAYNAYKNALKNKFGNKYTDDRYDDIATFMTCQSACESGYGNYAGGRGGSDNFNWGGHMYKGKKIYYGTLDEYMNAHMTMMDKWDYMGATSLTDYINRLHQGQYKYSTDALQEYTNRVLGTQGRVTRYINSYKQQLNNQAAAKRRGGKLVEMRRNYHKWF